MSADTSLTESSKNATVVKASVGRPLAILNWPSGEFTIETLKNLTKLSKVTLYGKVHEALEQKQIVAVGKEKVKRGHPRIVFKKANDVEVQTTLTNNVPSIATLVSQESKETESVKPVVL